MDKFCEDCIHNEVCQYGAIPPHIDRCNDKDTLDDIRPHGKWIAIKPYNHKTFCSVCQQETWEYKYHNFCSNCGASMDMRGDNK